MMVRAGIVEGAGSGGGSGDVTGPAVSTDNALVRFDAASGKLLQDGVVLESDAGALSGVTQLDVDNLRLDGNVLSSTNANGNIALTPNGTGQVTCPAGTASAPGISFTAALSAGIHYRNGALCFDDEGAEQVALDSFYPALLFRSGLKLGFTSSTTPASAAPDLTIERSAAKVAVLLDGSTGGAALRLKEMASAPTAVADSVVLYAEDNGSGKTRLMALFPTGAAQQVSIEP